MKSFHLSKLFINFKIESVKEIHILAIQIKT